MLNQLPPRIQSKIRVAENGCWLWTGAKASTGYGNVYAGRRGDGRKRWARAHRYVYEFFNGPVPEGMHLDHRCRTPLCVCPLHLDVVTPRENIRRGLGHGHELFCPRGHRYDAANTYVHRNKRFCRTCRRLASPLIEARRNRQAALA